MGVSGVTMAATIALTATSLAAVSLTLSLFAWGGARPATADDKTNGQAPFIQSGVMTRDKQPERFGPLDAQSVLMSRGYHHPHPHPGPHDHHHQEQEEWCWHRLQGACWGNGGTSNDQDRTEPQGWLRGRASFISLS